MKRSAALLACLLLVACNAEQDAGEQSPATETFNAAEFYSANEREMNAEAIHHEHLEQARAHLDAQRYREALAGMKAAHVVKPEKVMNHLFRCMLHDRLNDPEPEVRSCYEDVIERLSAQAPCEVDLNCVIANLLAGGPDAEQQKNHFLELPAPAGELELRHFILDEFDREAYLKSILP